MAPRVSHCPSDILEHGAAEGRRVLAVAAHVRNRAGQARPGESERQAEHALLGRPVAMEDRGATAGPGFRGDLPGGREMLAAVQFDAPYEHGWPHRVRAISCQIYARLSRRESCRRQALRYSWDLEELDENPVGLSGMDEGLLPPAVQDDVDGFDPVGPQVVEPTALAVVLNHADAR